MTKEQKDRLMEMLSKTAAAEPIPPTWDGRIALALTTIALIQLEQVEPEDEEKPKLKVFIKGRKTAK